MKYKIADTQDAKGEYVSLWHSDYLAQNKEVGVLYYDAISFLLKQGWAMSPYQVTTNAHKVIWAENSEGVVMGGVVYEYHITNRQGWIVVIFTDDKFRGRHVYSLLQRALENEIIRLGGTSIASQAHIDNEPRLIAGRREGMLPEYVRLKKDLTPVLEDRKVEMTLATGKTWDQLSKEQWNGNTNPNFKP
jgi:hypothetical protein